MEFNNLQSNCQLLWDVFKGNKQYEDDLSVDTSSDKLRPANIIEKKFINPSKDPACLEHAVATTFTQVLSILDHPESQSLENLNKIYYLKNKGTGLFSKLFDTGSDALPASIDELAETIVKNSLFSANTNINELSQKIITKARILGIHTQEARDQGDFMKKI